jgi:hypothetical protein
VIEASAEKWWLNNADIVVVSIDDHEGYNEHPFLSQDEIEAFIVELRNAASAAWGKALVDNR